MTYLLTPVPRIQFFDQSGNPLVNAKLYTYRAGTTTPLPTYQTAGGTANTNPVRTDSGGWADVWLDPGELYKMSLLTSADALVWTVDNIGGAATLAALAGPGGAALVGLLQAGTNAAVEDMQTWGRRVGVWPEQFGAASGGFSDARVQRALNAVPDNGVLYLADNYLIAGGTLSLINRSNVLIRGPGRLTLDAGAGDTDTLLRLSGTCDRIRVSGVTFVGPGRTDAAAFQYGFYNLSGQTISQVIVDGCTFEGLNAGAAFNADNSGTYTNAIAVNNIIRNMTGTLGGQGYGIFASNVKNFIAANNEIENTERHAVYVARGVDTPGADMGVLIAQNVIRGHRSTVMGAIFRPSIYFARGYGGTITGNKIIDYYDCAIGVSHDTTAVRSTGDVQVLNNVLSGRKNAVSSILIGEQLAPTTDRTSRVKVEGNHLWIDESVGGVQAEIEVASGTNISIRRNSFYLQSIPNGVLRLIELGTFSSSATDLNNVAVTDNEVRGSAAGTPALVLLRTTRLVAALCSSSAYITVRNNDVDPTFTTTNIEYAATRTGQFIIDQFPNQPAAGVYTAGDTSPTVIGGVGFMVVANAAPTNLDTLDDPVDGQQVTLLFSDANTTVKYNTGTPPFRLPGGADIVSANRKTVVLQYSAASAAWFLISVSANS